MKKGGEAVESLERLLELFESDLDGVAFPQVDRSTLREAAAACDEQQRDLDEAEESVAQRRHQLASAQSELSALADKAVAYLRIYAGDDEPLLAKIDALAPRKAKRTKRGNGPASKSSAGQSSASQVAAADASVGDGHDSPGQRGEAKSKSRGRPAQVARHAGKPHDASVPPPSVAPPG